MLKIKKYKKSLIFLLITIVIILIVNRIISNVIEQKVTELLLKTNSEYYTTQIEDVKFNLFSRSITLNNLFLSPTSKSFSDLKNNKSSENTLDKVIISSIDFEGIHLLKIIFNNDIKINTLNINDLNIHVFKKNKLSKKEQTKNKKINLDSIYIKKLNGLQVDKIKINNIKYQIFDFSSNKIIFQHEPFNLTLDGFKLEKYYDQFFKIKLEEELFKIDDIKINFPKNNYTLFIQSIAFDFKKDIINIQKFIYKPLKGLISEANNYKYNKEFFDIDIENIKVCNYDIIKTFKKEGVFIDSILVSKMELNIFKDKTKPWDTKKIKKLPHIALKQMELPLFINKIKINNSNLFLEEKFEKKDILMKVSLNNLNAQISNITSIKAYRKIPLRVNLNSKLMNKAPMQVDMTFPLNDNQNIFYFNGSLGASRFSYFDEALFPILGIKILKGNLDDLTFSASADNVSSSGKMTMLYHNFEADVFKNKSMNENKFLSWTVNTLIHQSNPKKNKKPREAILHYDRENYKGLGNYFWKTIQSGIINTLIPGGKTTEKTKAKKERKLKRKLNNK